MTSSTSGGELPIRDKHDWWAYWQANEQMITELYVKLTPGIAFSAAAPVIAVIGHNRNKEMALAALKTLRDKLSVYNIDDNMGKKAVLHLSQYEDILP